MMGMATPAQVAELGTLESTAFDRLFLQLMVRHHGGAIDMVETLHDQPGTAYDPVMFEFTNDLVKELYAEHVPGRAPLLTSLSMALLAARAAGVQILDGVYNDVKDAEGFLAECAQGRQMGFDGKTLIHPGQVEPANEQFAPSAEAVEDARGLIEAFESAGSGVATYKNKMIENLHVESARRTLTIHEAISALG